MELNLIATGKADILPDGTYEALGLTATGFPRPPDAGMNDGGLADVLAAVTWGPEDIGDHVVVFEAIGREGVFQREEHPFHILAETKSRGAYVAKFSARIPFAEPFVRIRLTLGDDIRHWTYEVEV